jgi:hypothetical protein
VIRGQVKIITYHHHHKNLRSIYPQNPSASLRLRGKIIKYQSLPAHIPRSPLRNLSLTPVLRGKSIKHRAKTIKQPYATMIFQMKTMNQPYATMFPKMKTMKQAYATMFSKMKTIKQPYATMIS